jgi:hypothetical protein
MASQSDDSENWLVAILLIAGIRFPLQFKRIRSIMPISAISQWREAYCRYISQNWFKRGKMQ